MIDGRKGLENVCVVMTAVHTSDTGVSCEMPDSVNENGGVVSAAGQSASSVLRISVNQCEGYLATRSIIVDRGIPAVCSCRSRRI